jgi:maleylacetate reductase
MSLRFVHESQPQRVCFGSGEAAGTVARELERLGASKVMVIASGRDRGMAERITAGRQQD